MPSYAGHLHPLGVDQQQPHLVRGGPGQDRDQQRVEAGATCRRRSRRRSGCAASWRGWPPRSRPRCPCRAPPASGGGRWWRPASAARRRATTFSGSVFGISTPTALLPGIGLRIRTSGDFTAYAMLRESWVIRSTLTPGPELHLVAGDGRAAGEAGDRGVDVELLEDAGQRAPMISSLAWLRVFGGAPRPSRFGRRQRVVAGQRGDRQLLGPGGRAASAPAAPAAACGLAGTFGTATRVVHDQVVVGPGSRRLVERPRSASEPCRRRAGPRGLAGRLVVGVASAASSSSSAQRRPVGRPAEQHVEQQQEPLRDLVDRRRGDHQQAEDEAAGPAAARPPRRSPRARSRPPTP